MTLVDQHTTATAATLTWTEPDGIAARGTVVLIPGRGEQPELYERFGRRIASDGYRVHAVAEPAQDEATATGQIAALLASDSPAPHVLAGSDTGALFALGLAASGDLPGVAALVLAGLPVPPSAVPATPATVSWDDELDIRTTCPTHRARLAAGNLRRGALYEPVPPGWLARADLSQISQPVLGLHGADDPVSPLAAARAQYATVPRAELVSIIGGRHDALNDQTHRTAAATIVLFLERLRRDPEQLAAIAVHEDLHRDDLHREELGHSGV
jgi:alpha-beta hydrolase superfamily lysophospholipase